MRVVKDPMILPLVALNCLPHDKAFKDARAFVIASRFHR
jgi:hypothetical protein